MTDVNSIGYYTVEPNQKVVILDSNLGYPEENIVVTDDGDNNTTYCVDSSKNIKIFDRSASKDTEGNDINDRVIVSLHEGESLFVCKNIYNETSISIFGKGDKLPKAQITCTGVEKFYFTEPNSYGLKELNVNQLPSDEELEEMIDKSIQRYRKVNPPGIFEAQV